MTLKDLSTSEVLFIEHADVTIYEGDEYVGFAGLSVGDTLNADASLMIWVIAD